MDELISIIIPVYNTEKYIARCLDTVINQTYRNLQIIIVNDGSTDKSGDICRDYAKKDSRIQYYYQANAGQAVARNRALDKMKGQYVAFIDSDDYVSYNYIETLYMELKKYSAQIAVCNYIRTSGKDVDNKNVDSDLKTMVCSGRELIYKFIDRDSVVTDALCNKLFSSIMFQNIRFPEGKIYEDFLICDKLLLESPKVVYLEKTLYYYIFNPKSTTEKSWNLRSMDILEQLERRAEYYLNNNEQVLYIRTKFDMEVYLLIFYYYFRCNGLMSKEEGKTLVRKYKMCCREIVNSNSISLLKKGYLVGGYFFPYFGGMIGNCILKK